MKLRPLGGCVFVFLTPPSLFFSPLKTFHLYVAPTQLGEGGSVRVKPSKTQIRKESISSVDETLHFLPHYSALVLFCDAHPSKAASLCRTPPPPGLHHKSTPPPLFPPLWKDPGAAVHRSTSDYCGSLGFVPFTLLSVFLRFIDNHNANAAQFGLKQLEVGKQTNIKLCQPQQSWVLEPLISF